MSLSAYVNGLISKTLNNVDSSKNLQTEIHPELNFRYNSLNLLISRRGVGKTFTVMTEIIKLSQLDDLGGLGGAVKAPYGGFSGFLYVSDKTNDATINNLIGLVKLKVRIISYGKVLPVLKDLMDAKSAYEEVLNKKLQNDISDSSKNDLFKTLDLQDWTSETPHTIILLDDAINILKDSRYKVERFTLSKQTAKVDNIHLRSRYLWNSTTNKKKL
jgi:hypothetical protein